MTGVQTCALPIFSLLAANLPEDHLLGDITCTSLKPLLVNDELPHADFEIFFHLQVYLSCTSMFDLIGQSLKIMIEMKPHF